MNRLRLLAYAINGRGLGHLTRQLAILREVRRLCAVLGVAVEAWVLTSSEADTLARREGFPSIKLPSKAMLRDAGLEPHRYLPILRAQVLQAVSTLQPDLLIVDTFPGGSFGELASAIELVPKRVLVARRVRDAIAADDTYRALLPLYERTIVPDEAGIAPILLRSADELLPRAEARRALGVPEGRRCVYVTVGGGGDVDAGATVPRILDALLARGWHVVVGAGPLYEGPERRGEGITWLDRYTAVELFSAFDAAVASAGYNTFHELMHAGVPTVFLPLPRISDDQAGRAASAVRAGAGRLARSIDEIPDLLENPGSGDAARGLAPASGARAAARAILEVVLPADDLALADRVLSPPVVRLLGKLRAESAREIPKLIRVLSGGTPSDVRTRRAALADVPGGDALRVDDPRDPAGRFARLAALSEAHAIPLERMIPLVLHWASRFPNADGGEVVASVSTLVAATARFDDWMGVLALLRAIPIQRTLPAMDIADGLARWLATADDVYDALRAFSRLEGGGKRPVGEVLHLLERGGA